MTIRQWIQRKILGRCSSPGSGCGGAADASLGAHGPGANAAGPPRVPVLRPQLLPFSLESNCGGGPHESADQRHQSVSRGVGEGGRPCAIHDGTVHFSEGGEEGARLQLLAWGSRPAGMKVGFPSDVDLSCG